METVPCDFCGRETAVEIHTIPDFLLDRTETVARLVRCENCGHVYQNPRPQVSEIEIHYPAEYDLFTTPDPSNERNWLQAQAWRYGMEKRVRSVTRHVSAGRLLDVGCATGHFIQAMRGKNGWQAEGVEISRYAADIARQRGLRVHTGTLESANYPQDAFDAVTMWDVLEHLHHPRESLAEVRRILKPGGILVFRVPNLDSIDAKIFGRYWVGYDAPRHLHFFRKSTIEAYLKETELDLLEMHCNIGNYPTTVLSTRFWLRSRVSRQTEDRIIRGLNHPLARIAAAPFSFLTGLGLRGALITAAARKP